MAYLIPLVTILLSAVFLTAALAKIIDFEAAQKAAADFGVPKAFSFAAMSVLVFLEASVALTLLFDRSSQIASIAACVLLAVFILATARLMFLGESPDCRCFGQLSSEPVGKASLIRNGVLFAFAAVVTYFSGFAPFSFSAVSLAPVVIGFVMAALLIASLLIALELRKRFETIEKRLKTVEQYSSLLEIGESGGTPAEGLPIGTLIPDVSVSGISGKRFKIRDLVADGVPVLAVFVSPDCLPCAALAEYFPDWEDILEDKVRFVLISSEEAGINLEKFGEANRDRIYLQQNKEASEALKARWTPTALLIAADGRVASTPAAGDTAIKELIKHLSETDDFDRPLYVGEEIDRISKKFGSKVPDFALERLDGTPFTAADLNGRPTLVVFWSLTCQFCTEMLDDMLGWKNGTESLGLAILADGDEDQLRDTGLGPKLIIDKGYKVSQHFGMFGTPSAVIVDGRGVVISETVQGGKQIELLSGGVLNGLTGKNS